jgi:hypothetical protein
MDFYTLIGLSSFILQLVVFALLVYGYYLKSKMKFRPHGLVMAAAVFLHLTLVVGIMIPSFVLAVLPAYIVVSPLMLVSVFGLIHAVTGIAAIVLGLWLALAWRLKKDINSCFGRKKAMMPTLILWSTSLLLGIVLFAIFYGPVLFA